LSTDNGASISSEALLARFIRVTEAALAAATTQQAAATIVNRIAELVITDRAVLVHMTGKAPIATVTGGGVAGQEGALADAVRWVRDHHRGHGGALILPPQKQMGEVSGALNKIQLAMGGTAILWLPLPCSHDENQQPRYGLWLERWNNKSWHSSEIDLLQHAALFLGRALTEAPSTVRRWYRRKSVLIGAALLAAIFAIPVDSSVTAPARVVPDQPHHLFASMDGIVRELLVVPGQRVEENTLLFRYDDRVLKKRLEEARRALAVARAELVRFEAAAYQDPEARARIPVQQLEVARAESDVVFFTGQHDRAEVSAPTGGVVVLDDPDALIGASLRTGQLVMSIADPKRTKLQLAVPAADAGLLQKSAAMQVFLDRNPLTGIPATVSRIGFDVTLSEQQIPSVKAEARWDGTATGIQPGQRGMAKIYGESTPLIAQLLRKPVAAIRTFLGI